MDVLLGAESCKMKMVNAGSYPQHISHWFDTDCQEVKQELRKCFRYFRKSKDKCRACECLLVVAFPCILGFSGKIFVESTLTRTFV